MLKWSQVIVVGSLSGYPYDQCYLECLAGLTGMNYCSLFCS